MELLISAASPRQLVIGKALGIGLAGATQVAIVLDPGDPRRSSLEDRIATALLGPGGRDRAVAPGAVAGAARRVRVYYVLGFALYSLDLRRGRVARQPARGPPDHRPAAEPDRDRRLPPGDPGPDRRDHVVHPARLVHPVLEPVRDADAAVGRAGRADRAGDLGRRCSSRRSWSRVIAVRIYGAGVLLYGQRPGLRAYVAAARGCGSRARARATGDAPSVVQAGGASTPPTSSNERAAGRRISATTRARAAGSAPSRRRSARRSAGLGAAGRRVGADAR